MPNLKTKVRADRPAAATKKETKPHLVSTQLSSEAYAELQKRAEKEDRSIGYLMRRAILEALGLDAKAA